MVDSIKITELREMIEVVARGEVLRVKEVGVRMIDGIVVHHLTKSEVLPLIAIMRI